MSEVVNDAKAEYNRAKDRLTKCLETTPDDKAGWSPAPTARTPIEIVAHAAMGTRGIHGMMKGDPFPFNDMAEIDAVSRAEEKKYSRREQALALLQETSDSYLSWLDTLTPEQVSSEADFGFAKFPMAAAITFPADHLRSHAAQIEYIQTIYGDRDWHM